MGYESDLLFDKFKIVSSPSSQSVATGTYNNSFIVANWETQKISKCVLNPNHVVAFQNKLKKLKKLNKLKAKQAMQNQQQQSLDVVNEINGNDAESKCETVNIVNVMDTDYRSNDVRDRDKMNGVSNGSHRDVEKEKNENEKDNEEQLRKPTWLQSSYFQKGNFDQKTLH